MEARIMEIAQRIKGLREILELTTAGMAEQTGVTEEEYLTFEEGSADFSFSFLFNCAKAFGVDMVELLTGEKPKLSRFGVVRAGQGLPVNRRRDLRYEHLAYRVRDKRAEPFLVTAPYCAEEQNLPIPLSRHQGQEFNYILKGTLKVQLGEHVELLGEGDSIYYSSSDPHGCIATGGGDCLFIAVVIDEAGNK